MCKQRDFVVHNHKSSSQIRGSNMNHKNINTGHRYRGLRMGTANEVLYCLYTKEGDVTQICVCVPLVRWVCVRACACVRLCARVPSFAYMYSFARAPFCACVPLVQPSTCVCLFLCACALHSALKILRRPGTRDQTDFVEYTYRSSRPILSAVDQ
jgi:hypothetical protein